MTKKSALFVDAVLGEALAKAKLHRVEQKIVRWALAAQRQLAAGRAVEPGVLFRGIHGYARRYDKALTELRAAQIVRRRASK